MVGNCEQKLFILYIVKEKKRISMDYEIRLNSLYVFYVDSKNPILIINTALFNIEFWGVF